MPKRWAQQERRAIAWSVAISLVRAMYEVRHVSVVFHNTCHDEFMILTVLDRNDGRALQEVTTIFHCLVTAMGALHELGLLEKVFPIALSLEVRIAADGSEKGGTDDFLGIKVGISLDGSPPRDIESDAKAGTVDWELVAPPR